MLNVNEVFFSLLSFIFLQRRALLKNLMNMIGFSDKTCIFITLQDATYLTETHPN